jgi:peptidoglycan hydrolase-like protein with peptidoglycan-binding domain
MPAISGALRERVRPAAGLLAVASALGLLFAGSAAASTAYSAASANPRPIASTGWHGRPIRHPHKPVKTKALTSASFPTGWKAGDVGYGTGFNHPYGSRRVREVQRRLKALGYRTGPIDGLYGPLTRSAVQWFQIKHGLRPTGVVAATTLTVLRNPNLPTRSGDRLAKTRRPRHEVGTRSKLPTPAPAPTHNQRLDWLIPPLIAALAVGALAFALLWRSIGPRALPEYRAKVPPALPPMADEHHDSAPGAPVLGYVRSDDEEGAVPHAAAILDACDRYGWELGHLIRDGRQGPGSKLSQPGLRFAMRQLRYGRASRLVVHELGQLAPSRGELGVTLGWFIRTGTPLTALDSNVDTGTREGRSAARSLLSRMRADHAFAPQARPRELSTGGHRGGPSVADRPELADRIRRMRAEGMSLRAIADTLNAEGVPTVRGGERWRPSSIQSVLGYKRAGAPVS